MSFSFGLSYTSFEISEPTVSYHPGANSSLAISGSISNTGQYAGNRVIQLYSSQPYPAATEMPVKLLVRFRKIELSSGEPSNFTFAVPVNELGYYVNVEWQVDGGNYTFYFGFTSKAADLETVNVVLAV